MSASQHPPELAAGRLIDLPLFPLGTVLFPDGLLALKVFEARYLDLMSACLRTGGPFGVVTLIQGDEARSGTARQPQRFEAVGCLATLQHCDSDQPGILQVQCLGGQRFELSAPAQQPGGLWVAGAAELIAADPAEAPSPDQVSTVAALRRAVANLSERGDEPFAQPHRYNDAGWVANRWCEILPIPLPTRHKLMALPDPQARLRLVDGFLRRHGIVSD
ncbi:MAG: LON peptidase substrate-binding domain-containing protein [Leptothrix sp. (in: b-proteobacteria)]